jgi:hypothetical protein
VKSAQNKVTLINPRSESHPIEPTPIIAPRLNSLDGKTVYVVDVRWPYTHQFLEEMSNVLSGKYPKVKFEFRYKEGDYGADDPKLWAEIKERGDAAIISVGH